MEALLLAAGLGTRLQPLTNDRPKALVEVEGHTLLEYAIRNLTKHGVTHIVVNVHHFAEKVCDFLSAHTWEVPISISHEEDLLLDTGGGLKKAASFFSGNEPILIHNVDIISSINLSEILEKHKQTHTIATLAVSERSTSRQLLFDDNQQLIGWHNNTSNTYLWANTKESSKHFKELAFSGIAVIEPELTDLLPESDHPYPIIPEYLKIAGKHPIDCYIHPADNWLDVGKPETLQQASTFIKQLTWNRF